MTACATKMFDVRFRGVVWWGGWFGFAALTVALPSQGEVQGVPVRLGEIAMSRAHLVGGSTPIGWVSNRRTLSIVLRSLDVTRNTGLASAPEDGRSLRFTGSRAATTPGATPRSQLQNPERYAVRVSSA